MRARSPARPLATAFLLLAALGASPASAHYEESHLTGDEARVTVDVSGAARIEHALSWRLVAGKPHGFDLLGTEPSAQPEPAVTLEAEDGRVLAATLAAIQGHGLHVTFVDPKALRHGQTYRVSLAYTVNLPAAGELVRDGSLDRLLWKSPVPSEGFDGARVTFVLPAALEAPSAIVGQGGMRDDGVTSSLKRETDHDEISLLRPHVGRGEEVLWAVRVAAKAFDAAKSPALAPPPLPPARETPAPVEGIAFAVIVLLGLAFAGAVRWKDRRFAALCAAFGEKARGVIPLGSWERSAVAGAALFVGLSLQLGEMPLVGAACLVLAMVCGTLRAPVATSPPRGPGRWLVLRPAEAFGGRNGRHVAALEGLGLLVGAAGLLFLGGRVLVAAHPDAPRLLFLDLIVFLPFVATGLASQLPPDRARQRGPWLARLFRRLRKTKSLHVSPWVRIPTGQADPDEVRVLALPRAPMPGLMAIEVGVAWGRAPTSFFASPEVLVRVEEATAASARMASLVPDVVPVPGRKPEERVYRLAPRFPTEAGTAALVLRLASTLNDRRQAEIAWAREERRVAAGAVEESGSSVPIPVLG
jgi:hypothetical protein